MTTASATLQQRFAKATNCEIRFDDLTRQLYATDASIYQIEPVAVALPKSSADVASLMRAAAEADLSVTPRGAGTGLAGGAVGDGLVVDLARYNRRITNLDRDRQTVRVEPGVVLDQLNDWLAPHGYWFGPDVATSSRATLGGMIANNSSGARVPVYGTTIDHIASLDVVLADGTTATIGPGIDGLPTIRDAADRLVDEYKAQINERLPEGLLKRWPGYAFDDYLRRTGDLTQLIAGSEGTLAAIVAAELRIVPRPVRRGIGVLFFDSVADAMIATVELLDLQAVAIEHIDRLLFDQTRNQRPFRAARRLLQLDEKPAESILIVEFFDDAVDDKLAELAKRNIGTRKLICTDNIEQELVWAVRKHGLNLLTACKGPAKPTPGIEDVCIRPERLPEYVAALRSLLTPLGIEASYYGHAASGELHVRPKVDLHTEADITKFRQITDGVSALCKQFKGSFAAEHGVGIARTEYVADHLGPELVEASRRLKAAFDPRNRLNPGKIIDDGRYTIDKDLRQGAGHVIQLPFAPVFGFIERDESFIGNLEQCNGNGQCRKDTPVMCPTYIATNEEIMSTRGRANTIRAALERRFTGDGDEAWIKSPELDAALSNCLSCKACKTECPSNVDMALLKAELYHAKHQKLGVPRVDRMIADADRLGRLGSAFAPLSNWVAALPPVRWYMKKTLGFTTKRPLPKYSRHRFDKWFAKRGGSKPGTRGRVILWDDTWVRYHEPNIGHAAVKVLEAAGFEVTLPTERKCCGRPAASRGVLDQVDRLARHNVAMFADMPADDPIIFLEASCHAMFIDEYRQLRIDGADKLADRCVLFEQFIYDVLKKDPNALPFKKNGALKAAIHGHCHAKALTDTSIMPALVNMIPDATGKWMDTACCGMAGAFGMLEEKYDLSVQVAQPLVNQIKALEPGTTVIASGTSCRHQIEHLTPVHPVHMAELLANAL